MNKITGNIFEVENLTHFKIEDTNTLELLKSQNSSNSKSNGNELKPFSEVEFVTTSSGKNKAISLKSSIQSLLDNYKINASELTEINVDLGNFSEHQYNLLNNKIVSLYLDKDTNRYRIFTERNYIFNITDTSIVSTILSLPRPVKIVTDTEFLKNFKSYTNIFDIDLISNIFNCSDKISKLIDDIDITEAMFNLLIIFNNIYRKCSNAKYTKYLEFEQNFKFICDKLNSYNFNVESVINQLKKKIYNSSNIPSNIINTTVDTESKLLKLLIENEYDISKIPLLDIKTLSSDSLCQFSHLLALNQLLTINDYNIVEHYNENALPLGCIDYAIPYIATSNSTDIIIKGSIDDLYFKILFSLLKNKDLRNYINCDSTVLKTIFPNEDHISLKKMELYIKCKVRGLTSYNKIIKFFRNNCCQITKEELIKLSELDKIKSISNEIEFLTNSVSNFKDILLITEKPCSSLNAKIYDYYRLIIKEVVININALCDTHKDIDIIYLSDNSIYLKCTKDTYEFAIDILTRNLGETFKKYRPNTKISLKITKL